MDKLFRVELLAKTPNPQKLCYAAMHTDYSEKLVSDELFNPVEPVTAYNGLWVDPMNPSEILKESEAGRRVISHCVKFGHWGVIEHPQITFNVGYFPHSVMQQARTHRISTSFDVQSFRYSGKRICNAIEADDVLEAIEKTFYLRPVGFYTDRKGKKYEYTKSDRAEDINLAMNAAFHYRDRIEQGFSEEHARGLIPFDVRQHFVVSFNLRSLLHFLDLRAKADAQLEIQWLCELMVPYLEEWVPEVWEFYEKNRFKRAKLAP
ncbi:MAG: FAD-dependent thymidylate synthase [Nodosilinea sp. WJT8-NPBG4]|jgi:thymidylate synthase (FAD)|nr:FAD-dependent thymidylate synthase [Nodosilinea sp. WJT8-NPBG4]